MKAHELKKAKRDVRRRVLAARDAVGPVERREAGEAVAARFVALTEVAGARTVAAFWSFGSEVPTAPLLARLQAADVTVALPRTEGDALRLLVYRDGDRLTPTAFGAMEPVDGTEIDPAVLDVVATPAAVFDTEGRRIGYGGGFYDRLFARAPRAVRIGIAYDLQVVEPPLPAGHFDLLVHAICTPSRTVRPGSPT